MGNRTASFPFNASLIHLSKYLDSWKQTSINVPNHLVCALMALGYPLLLMGPELCEDWSFSTQGRPALRCNVGSSRGRGRQKRPFLHLARAAPSACSQKSKWQELDKQFNLIVTEFWAQRRESHCPFLKVTFLPMQQGHWGCAEREGIDFSWQEGQPVRKDLNGHAVKRTWKRLDRSDLGSQEEKKKSISCLFL